MTQRTLPPDTESCCNDSNPTKRRLWTEHRASRIISPFKQWSKYHRGNCERPFTPLFYHLANITAVVLQFHTAGHQNSECTYMSSPSLMKYYSNEIPHFIICMPFIKHILLSTALALYHPFSVTTGTLKSCYLCGSMPPCAKSYLQCNISNSGRFPSRSNYTVTLLVCLFSVLFLLALMHVAPFVALWPMEKHCRLTLCVLS